jgi:hypothetical protein
VPNIHAYLHEVTALSHQANSNTWQQTLIIHPNNNRGTETQQSTSDFDVNGNLLTLDNPRGGRGSSADIKGIFGFKYRRISSPLFFSFIEVVLRLKVLVTFKENLPLSLFLRKLR